jgi:amino acid adenylation domain-containing protein/non-ribosomal peptide synthase protein (TIGR01720 family)
VTTSQAIQGFRLSPLQERLWLLQRAAGGQPPHGACAYAVEGALDAERLDRALREAIARHEILRTTFVLPPGTTIPVQVVTEEVAPRIERHDLSALDERERRGAAAALTAELWHRPFDLERGPLLHLSLVGLGPARHRLLVAWCGLCDDLPGIEGLVDEVLAGHMAPSGEPTAEPLQYADVAAWQRDLLRSEETEAERGFWSPLVDAAARAVALPSSRRASGRALAPAVHELPLEPELATRLDALAERLGSEPRALLLTSWQVLLWRLTGQVDLAVAVAFDGRTYEELAGAQGPFTRYLPIRVELSSDLPFADAVGRVARFCEQAAGLQDHFAWEAGPAGTGALPSLPFGFDLHVARERTNRGGLDVRLAERFTCGERFQVVLSLLASAGSFLATLVYDQACLAAGDAERLGRHWLTLLAGALNRPETPLSELELLADADRRQLLVGFNDTAARFAAPDLVHRLWEARAARMPGDAAVSDGARSWSSAELDRRANRMAHRLRRLGVGPEVPVAICAERSLEGVAALLAVLKAGGVAVPLDPSYPPERLDFLLEDSGAAVLLAGPEGGFRPAVTTRTVAVADGCDGEPEVPPSCSVSGAGAAWVIYTSGSTGRPKGVLLTHAGLANRLLWGQSASPLGAGDRVLQLASQSFDFAIWEVLAPLAFGATLVLAAPDSAREPAAIVRQIRDLEVTVAHFVPSLFRLVLEEPGIADCRSLRLVFAGGEALPGSVAERFHERSSAVLANQYGPTEASIDVTWWRCSREDRQGTVPIGHPIANTRIHLLDTGGRPAAIGVPGELWIGGHGLARGYLGRPERTAERFLPDPFSREPGARLYRTGDLGRYRADGCIDFLGRVDHQVKIRGHRVEPGEVEAVLGRHPAVREAAVQAQEHAPGQSRLVVYVVGREGATPPGEELRAWLGARLPEFMVPTALVSLLALPRLPNGKLDRRALPSPDFGRSRLGTPFAPPRTELERLLAEIWAGVLGIAEVGVDDDFFALGGDSILSMQISARARQAGLRLTPRQLFEHPTIADLAPLVESRRAAAPEEPELGPVPLTPIQRRFFEQERPEPQHFNQPVLLEVWRGLEPQILKRALGALLTHHDALRLRFRQGEHGWEQLGTDPGESVTLARVDLSGLPDAGRAAALAAAAGRLQRTLDLTAGPLVRAALFDLGLDEPRRLLLVVHHLAVDAVSWRILIEDLETACRQVARGEPAAPPPTTTSFRRWARRLAEHAASGVRDAELPYWLDERRRGVVSLPRDGATGGNSEGSARGVTVALTAEETVALLQEVPAAYHTRTEEVLLAALAGAVASWTGERTVLVDVEGHGREDLFDDLDLSRTVGWFTSVHPLLLELPAGRDPGSLLKAVKEQVRAVPGRGIGYGLLRYAHADSSHFFCGLPAAEIGFNYLGRIGAIDGAAARATLFAPAREGSGPARAPRAERAHLLEIDGVIAGGRLEVRWVYGEQVHARETVAAAAGAFLDSLRRLIAHCRSPEAGGYTPSDFPDVDLDQGSLEDLLAELGD